MFAAVVSASIVVRFGLIEAVLRFYYKDDEDPDRVVASTFAGLFWFATIGALVALPFATPISEALLDPKTAAERAGRPGADLDRRPLGADDVRVPADPVPARGAGPGLLRDHDRQRPGHDRADRRPRRRRRRGRPRPAARQLRQRRRLRARPDRAPAPPPLAAASTAPCCGGCCASACRRCRPRSRSTCSTSSTGSSSSAPSGSPRPASTRWRSSSPRRSTSSSAASSSPGRRSPTRSATTTRPAAPTPPSSPSSSPAAPSSSPACGCSRAGSCARWRRRSSSTPTKRSA